MSQWPIESPVGESSPFEMFRDLLGEECDAARRADVDALSAVQERKRDLMPAILDADLSEDERAEMQWLAQRNVHLIRQLVQCLSGMLTPPDDNTYDAQGKRSSLGARGLRGTL